MLETVDNVARIIQVALTPIFLLSGIAGLLNVFAARSGRVSDQVYKLSASLHDGTFESSDLIGRQLAYLRHRSLALDAALILATLAGALTCLAAILLFVGSLRDQATDTLLFTVFGLAILFTMAALSAFLTEMLLAGRGVRSQVKRSHAEVKSVADPIHAPNRTADGDANARN